MKEETGINRSGLEAACQDRVGTLPENGQMIDLQLTVRIFRHGSAIK
jgi:hypothetical protein